MPVKLKTTNNRLQNRQPSSHGFFADVYDVVRQIPRGRVTTYGAIAVFLGTALSARMVGWAMNASHEAFTEVPAHRVVNRNGMLTGKHHFKTPSLMEELLLAEDIVIIEEIVQNFKEKFWDPSVEIGM